MRVFILEDDPGRMQWFRERFIGHDVTHADSATQADRFVGPYDVVFLDHDLGGRVLVQHEDDGVAFAECVKGRIGEATVVVHSYNHAGAQRILATLDDRAIIAPFRGPTFTAALAALEKATACA